MAARRVRWPSPRDDRDLIAGDASFPRDRQGLFKVVHIEIADPPGQNLAVAPQFLRTAPMQEIAVNPIGPPAAEGALAARDRPCRRGMLRENLGQQKNFVAPPGDRLANQFLGCALAVHLRCIDMGHAKVETAAQSGNRRGGVALLEIPCALAKIGTSCPVESKRWRCMRVVSAFVRRRADRVALTRTALSSRD